MIINSAFTIDQGVSLLILLILGYFQDSEFDETTTKWQGTFTTCTTVIDILRQCQVYFIIFLTGKKFFGCEPDTLFDQGMGGAYKITYNLQTGGRYVISVSFPVIHVPVKCVLSARPAKEWGDHRKTTA